MSTAIGADNWNSPPAIGEGILKELNQNQDT